MDEGESSPENSEGTARRESSPQWNRKARGMVTLSTKVRVRQT
jgi:hypothetical protein